MKKCPECEFIYEDDQTLCDMDGALLVYDSRTLPNLHALTALPERTQRRNRAVPAFATVILAFVLGLVYYVSTQRTTHTAEIPPVPAAVTEPAPPAPAVELEEAAPIEADKRKETRKEESKPAAGKQTSSKKSAAKSDSSSQSKVSTENKKDDSKVGSILKKTGKILKKPFKL